MKSHSFVARCMAVTLVLSFTPLADATAEGWPHWRGPNANGSAPNASPPVTWDGASGTNIRWRAELIGEGSATPIVWHDQVFIVSCLPTDRLATQEELPNLANRPKERPGFERKTVEPKNFYRFLVTSYDRDTGKVNWRKTLAEAVPHEGHHATHSYASGSPTTDGERLYVSFGSFGIFCLDLKGSLLWERQLGKLSTRRGYGEAVTPVIHKGRLLINWDQETDSALYCLDAKTGKTIWKADRDEITTWTTPLVTEFEGTTQVILNGSRKVRSHDLETGRVLWSCEGMTDNAIPSALRSRDAVIVLSGYQGNCGVSVPLSSRGDLGRDGPVNWRIKSSCPYVPSPALVGDHLYFTKGNSNVLIVLDAATGVPVIGGERISELKDIYASPIFAGGRVYITDRGGVTAVLQPGRKLNVVATNSLGDGVDASPVAVGKQLFLRGQKMLFCIEQPEPTFERMTLLEHQGATSAGVSLGDIDGDGHLDIVLAKGRHWPLDNLILRNDGKGNFTFEKLPSPADRTYSAALADVDGDGSLDLVVSNDRPDRKLIYLNDGRGHFKVAGTFGRPEWPTRYITMADLNGDGFPDIVVANRSSDPAKPTPSYVCLNDRKGGFPNFTPLATQSATIICAADLDGDGKIDLFVPHRDGGQSLIFWNDGAGTFAAAPTSFGPKRSTIRAAIVADLDGDGVLDIVVGDAKTGLFIYRGNGHRTFAEPISLGEKSGPPYSIGVFDLNRDGKLDLIVGRQQTRGSIFYNQSAANSLAFAETPWNDGKGTVYGVAIGDLNGDGWPDIVAARSDAPNAIWFSQPPAKK